MGNRDHLPSRRRQAPGESREDATRLWSVPRLTLDVALWAGAGLASTWIGTPWVTLLAVLFIGAVPMHDLLVHGHEGTHRHLARGRRTNAFFTWLTHAVVGISGTSYRVFHLVHHRYLRTERDPEYRLLDRVVRGAPGWSYLGLPLVAHLHVNAFPLRRGCSSAMRRRVAADLAGIVLLHAGLLLGLGLRHYLLFVTAPVATGLSAVVVLRSLCEHHGADRTDPWKATRTMVAGRLLDLLWSNTSYHLEHHLYPSVPFHRLPDVRRAHATEMARRGSLIDDGFLRTAVPLLFRRDHFLTRES